MSTVGFVPCVISAFGNRVRERGKRRDRSQQDANTGYDQERQVHTPSSGKYRLMKRAAHTTTAGTRCLVKSNGADERLGEARKF
jgi:hypothetical protein